MSTPPHRRSPGDPPRPGAVGNEVPETERARQEKLRAVQARVRQRRTGGRGTDADAAPESRQEDVLPSGGTPPDAGVTRRPAPSFSRKLGGGGKVKPTIANVRTDAAPTPRADKPEPPGATGKPPAAAAVTPERSVPERMATIAQITEAGLRAKSLREASAILVNRVAEVVPGDRAVLVELGMRPHLVNVSGGGVLEQDSRFSEAVSVLNRRLRGHAEGVVIPNEPEDGGSRYLREFQSAMRGTQILWLPLPFDSQQAPEQIRYALWLERWRGRVWLDEEIREMNRAAVLFGQMLRPRSGRVRQRLSKRKVAMVIVAVLLGVLMIPVESSSVAPARVVPAHPSYVFAPLEGVLKELAVKPGQEVAAGDVLFRYDTRVIDKKLDEAVREVAVARAELERLEGAAFRDADARSKLPVQRLEVELAESNLAFLREQRERADVRAASAGVVVLDDPDALVGKPLQLGEQVFGIADPEDTKLRLMVPSSDAGLLREGQRIELRLDRDPLKSLPARVTRIGFDIVMSDDGLPSIVTEGAWEGALPDAVQPGQRGSAKVISDPQPLWKQVFRKPLIKLREITGL